MTKKGTEFNETCMKSEETCQKSNEVGKKDIKKTFIKSHETVKKPNGNKNTHIQ